MAFNEFLSAFTTENSRLRDELAAEKVRNLRLLDALTALICALGGGHPGTDALLADLHTETAAPASPGTADPTSPATAPGEPS